MTAHLKMNSKMLQMYWMCSKNLLQMENRINEEVVKKRAVKFYFSLHVNFHLSTDVAFLSDPPAVFSTDAIEVYDSSDVHNALNSTYENLVSAFSNVDLDGFWKN